MSGRVSKIRLVADQRVEIHPYIERPAPMRALEFDIPAEATRDGTLTLQWSIEPGQGGFTSSAAVAEVSPDPGSERGGGGGGGGGGDGVQRQALRLRWWS